AETLTTLREQFGARGRERFLPNLDALRCRVDLRLRDDDAVEQWYREKAPKDRLHFQVMKRYQYFTQAMVELSRGEAREALLTLAPLQYYCRVCSRHIDGIHLNVLTAIAQYRLRDDTWQETLRAALDEAYEYSFVRTISVYGVAVLPLLEACGWEKESAFLNVLIDDARDQAAAYPDFLEPHLDMTAPLSNTELQVLRLICADKSNAEIGAILGIRLATVKTHVSHILQKLGVKRRSEAKTMAEKLHLL
ncbi:MAG: LuxR C-terminal-related transcriptional regulator, partial [Peptococcaceae bacterium]|nr:LuxR C-terminal-related transcriptional regulator [Peptococcaceae bacterium]